MKDVRDRWVRIVTEIGNLLTGYTDESWDTLQLNPGEVTPLDGTNDDRVGFSVLLPDNEFKDLKTWLNEGVLFDNFRVLKYDNSRPVLSVILLEDTSMKYVVGYPLFYKLDETVASMFSKAGSRGQMSTYFRRLSGEYIEILHDDPSLFQHWIE